MRIFYQGTDISDMVTTTACVIRDTCGSRCDSVELEFDNAAGWYSWGPEEDDVIVVTESGYDSGRMYVHEIVPFNGKYRILAASLPCKSRAKGYQSFYNKTLGEITRMTAAAAGLGYQMWGVKENLLIPYIARDGESCAAFLDRLLTLEGAVLKCINGRFDAIGIEWAQNRTARQAFEVRADGRAAEYSRTGTKIKGLTVVNALASAYAEDTSVPSTHERMTCGGLPLRNAAQAGRWARGKLLHYNRSCEAVYLQTGYDPGMTAMEKVNLTGDTDATGEWLVEEVTHDLIKMTSEATLRRCIRSIK